MHWWWRTQIATASQKENGDVTTPHTSKEPLKRGGSRVKIGVLGGGLTFYQGSVHQGVVELMLGDVTCLPQHHCIARVDFEASVMLDVGDVHVKPEESA